MARPDDLPSNPSDGFEGEVAGMGLSDLIQLNARNRFSGCFRIRHQGNLGLIFFRDGDIVHAEQGAYAGEEAFCQLLGWPAGRFSVEPNVVTARRTIQKSCEHLLLDAHRLIDERRISAPEPPVRPPAPRATGPSGAVQLVRGVPGVAGAVVLTRAGKRVSEDGYESEVLAGQAVYLAMFGQELGALFQAGEIHFAAAQGARRNLLLFAAKSHYLGVFADPESEIGAIDAAIRAALAASR
jgi:predicted regulator of Ras-like GTPase activity (Roadblock/LC7/MglB family)